MVRKDSAASAGAAVEEGLIAIQNTNTKVEKLA
jgi:hypothetical protein